MIGDARDALRRAMMTVARGVIRAVGDGTPLQTVQVSMLADESKEGVERVQEYGFTSVPVAGADAVLVFVGGNRDHGVIVATDDRNHRPGALQSGDVAVYDNRTSRITLTADGIAIETDAKVTITAPEIEITGNVSMTGNVSIAGDLSVNDIDYLTHVHPENDGGGPTDPPQVG